MTIPGGGGVFSAPSGVSGLLAMLPNPALLQAALLQRPFSTCFPSRLLLLFFLPPWDLQVDASRCLLGIRASLVLINSMEGGWHCSS